MIKKYILTPLAIRLNVPCRDATRLMSESMDRSLPFSRWVSLRAHLYLCDVCTRYRDQLLFLRQLLKYFPEAHDHAHGDQDHGDEHLSEEARARIKEKLRQPPTS